MSDGFGFSEASADVLVRDTVPPEVRLTRPTSGTAYVLDSDVAHGLDVPIVAVGALTLRADASDACGLALVRFTTADGAAAGDATAPHEHRHDPALATPVLQRVNATALDLGNNAAAHGLDFLHVGSGVPAPQAPASSTRTALAARMTFSIVAADLAASEWAVAVASKFLAVGSVVPWARAGAGAVATQALANASYGPRGLDLLAEGASAEDVVRRLTSEDDAREHRQLGVVDREGRAATFTGEQCHAWAGGRAGRGYACQGNILAGARVVDAMADAFERAEGPLAERVLAALRAGDEAGGDKRGRQSAALLVVKPAGGYGGTIDRMIDLRVDDHSGPVPEVERLLRAWRLYAKPTEPPVAVEGGVRRDVEAALVTLGYLKRGEPLTETVLQSFLHTENFEEREHAGFVIDPGVLRWLRERL